MKNVIRVQGALVAFPESEKQDKLLDK